MVSADNIPSTWETARSEDVAVPRAPTKEMLRAMVAAFWGDPESLVAPSYVEDMRAAYKAMLAAAPRPDARTEAEQRVLAVRGSWDAPGFDACVKAEMARATGDVAAKLAEIQERYEHAESILVRKPDAIDNAFKWAHKAIGFLLPHAERAAALEQENERLRKFLADVVRIVRAYSGNALEHRLDGWSASPPICRTLGEGR